MVSEALIWLLALVASIVGHCEGLDDASWSLTTNSLPTNSNGGVDLKRMASVGNGHIASVVYSDTIYMNGLYNGVRGWSHRAEIRSHHDVRILVNDTTNNQTYKLDMWKGWFEETINTLTSTIKLRTYAHQHYTQLMVTEIEIIRTQNIVNDSLVLTLQRSSLTSTDDILLDAPEPHTGVERCSANCMKTRGITKEAESDRISVAEVFLFWTDIPSSLMLAPDEVYKNWTFVTSIDSDMDRAQTVFQSAMNKLNSKRGELQQNHVDSWTDKWKKGRIDVEGDTELNTLVHSSMYYTLSSLPSTDPNQPNEPFYGLSPGGLANGDNSSDFRGHVLVDMEAWMFPPFLMFFPEIAKSLLNYRVRNMEAAGEAATTRGYQGLRYPSESGVSGDELSFGEMNHEFITADIAFAARQYISATRDLNWLRGDSGYTFIRDLANFWQSRALWNDVKSAYEISGVTGPDENAVNVSNSVYTNVAVKMAIKFSRYVACLTDLENVNEIKEEWLGKATKIFIPYDDSGMYHPEYEGYVSAVVKGVDAILLGFPLMFEMNETVRRSDLAIYENLTDPKSSAMTWAMFAINLLEMGDTEKAFTFFQKSHSGYPRKPFNVWNKEVSGEGDINFSGMGTFLQTLIFGYGGARLHVETLTFEPKLPTNVTSLHFIGLDYLGTTFDLYIKSNRVIIVVQQTSDYSIYLRLVSTNTEFHLMNGKEIMIPRTAFTLYTTNITDCPLPEGSSCPTSVSDNGQMSSLEGNEDVNNPIQYVVVKQTGGDQCADHWTCTSRERAIQKEDGSYNFLIGQDGRIYIGSGWQLQTNTRLNTTTLTIGMIGDFICNTPNEKSLGALQHLLKCGISRKLLSERYVILSNHQLLKNAEILANHNQLYCGIMSSRHWMEYQYEGDFNPPVCDGECFQPQIKPDSLYRDISDQPTIFEATELPMKDGKIDFRYMASVGNGHLATVIYSPTIYINGLFNGPTGWSHRARIPSTHAIRIAVPGSNTFNISHNYKLDVQQAIFEETIDTPSAVVKQRTYAHQYYNRLLVTEIELIRKEEAVEDIVILLSNNPGSNSEDINFNEPENITNHKDFSKYSIECWYQDGVTLQTEINSTDPQNVYMYSTKLPTSLELDENVKHQTWVYVTSIDIRKNAAEESFTKALSLLMKDTQALYTSHIAAWETRWAEGRIVLEGDNYISKRIYGSFYYLLSFLPATDPFIKNNQFYGLSPGGLANGANWTDYQGHVFWDMETWMYPTMLMFHPDLAKEMLSYRIYAMEPAYERAKITDPVSKGLRYPWESALTGVEQTPDICVPCRENQQHITGDIALAARQYLSVTKDLTWLKREQGFTFIRDMAEFWASRPVYNPSRDSYDVNGVMPPDEHAQNINNSAYTNVGAKLSIYFAEYAACLMGNHSYDIPEYWLNVADKLYLPFNAEKNYHPEFEGYEDWTDERGVKQADTIMLGYPQMWAVDTEVRRNDLIHYEKVTNPMGPAMTWGMFSIGWLELGDEHKAHELFHRSYSPYVREPFKIWTEARSGIGAVNFITGMGGFLQAVYFGYGGARIYTEHMEFNPRLPPGNTALKFLGMNYLKNSLDIEIYEKKMLIILRKTAVENQLFVQIHSSGAEIILTEGKEVVLVRQAFSLRSKSLSGCLLPKDEILKAENCPRIISRSTWGGEPACDSEKTDDMVNNIIIKHTGSSSCSDFTTCSRIVEDIQTGEMKNGSSDISYNFLLGDDKRIYQGRGWGVIPGLGGERSPRTLAIGIIGDYSCKPLSWNTLYKVKRLIRCGIEGKKISTGYIISVEKNTPQLYNQIMEWRNQPLIEYSQACDETIPDLQGDIKDINGTETVFKSKSLPMKDGEIDYRYMASIGNGHIATIALSPTVYMNGLYNGEMGYTHRARIPSLVSYNIKVNDEDTTRSYSLDVQKAVFIEMIDTPTLTIEYRVYAHQYYVRLLVAEIIVTRKMQQAEESTVFVTRRVTSFESEDIVFNESIPITEKHVCGNWNCKRRHGRTKIPESGKVDLKDVYVLWNELPTTLTLSANKMSDRWISLVAIDPAKERCELDFSAGQRDVVADTNLVYQRHIDAWSKKWDNGRIEIKDNLQLSKLVYGSLYYILSSLPSDSTYLPTNQFFGLSPGGLANGANFTDYQGHVFWDMETWMYPGILMFHPELAKAMLSYRLFSMPAARERAGAGGYDGIRYPWEGGSTGAEVTPDICIPCRENQQHVTGDIAFAARQYVSATRDLQWLKTEMGYQFIREMAAFWVSRAEEDWNNETMMYNINGVMPPDEYQIRINNSVYTNIGAKLSIMFAEYAACLAGTAEDDAMIEKWRHVADNIYVPFNEFKRYHPEFEGFEDVTGDRKIIKQADAILTGFPQMWSMPEDVRRNDLELYEKITDHGGPAMTWGMFSIGWLELGDENKAREFFHKSYSPYVREPFKVWTEAQSGIGAVNFITGMGGFLQAVLFGYGGVRLRVEKLEFDPEIIPGTSGMRLVGLDYLGNSLNIDVYEEVIKIVKTKASEHTIDLVTSDSKIKFILHSHREYKIKRQAFTIQALTVTECPLPEGNSCPYVVPRSSWFTSKMEGIRQSMESVTEVVIDQTNDVSCTNYKNCIQQLQLMKKTSQLKGEIDISYNFLVDMSGNVYEGTGWEYTTSTLTSRLVIGVFGDYTCMDVKLRSVAAIKNLIKCGLEMEKISKSYALVSGRQTRKPDCLTTTCMGDSLLCTIMKWKYWNNTQYDGTFVAPNCYGSCVHPSKAEWNKNSIYHDISTEPTVFQTNKLPMKVDDPSEIDYRYMTSVGNGHLATLLYSDTIYVNGLYNGPTGWSHRARIPATQALFLSHPGITDRLYSLDVKRAVFEETFNVGEVKVTHRTYAHQYYTRLLVTEIILSTSSAQSTPVSIQVRNNRGEDRNDIEFSNNVEYINSNYRHQKGQTKIPELSDGKTQPVYIYYTVIPQVITLSAMTTHNKYTFVTSIDLEDWASKNTFDEALRILDVHPDNLYKKHISEWHIKWFNGRIDVDGNTELSKYIYSCFYYLMSFLPSQNVFLPNRKFSGLSPGGLANGANWTDYQGHVFWDMETWMYPGILMFHPELAQEMLSYRTDNMKPAYERAKANGQEGLRYPWESARTGVEVTPDVCVACRENQQHVTGDIALAARQYVSATRDLDWLRGKKGYVFIRDMAKYWYTRPEYNEVTKKYDINGVMPPDEHAESVNNSVYTNVGAKLSINFARYAACLAGEDSTGEVPDEWLERAKKIALPFDERKMFHPEYDGYREDKDPRGIKQADVILLGFPQMWPVDDEVRRNDLIHYEKVNNPLGPAMTWGMFSINWLELGEDEKAADLFKRSYSLYTREPFKIWTEARAGIGAVNFLTGMGGFLQTVVFGYGGARLHTEKLTFNPKLPPSTEGLRFTGLNYVGNSLDIVIKPDYVTVVARMTSEENPLILTVDKSGASHKIRKDKEILITRQAFTLRSLTVSECPLPEGDSCPDIITRREWQAVEPRDTEITGVVDKVIIQQTGDMECNTLDACKKRVKKLQLIHQTSGVKGLVLGDIAYNFLIGSDGRVYKGRGWGLGPYHPDVDVRLSSLSIAFVGDFTCTDISDEAKMAAQQLIKCARERKKISRDYKLVFESQMFMPLCKKDTCDGDKLFCVVQSWFQWSNIQTGGGLRQPNCNGKCKTDDIPNSKILPLYEDTSKIATVFATERLPMKPSTSEIDYRFMASVGNGHIATVVYSDTIYMNGLYNGPSGWSHRARIPSILGVRLSLPGVSDTQTQYALDVQRGVFEEIVNSSDVSILMRTYAHQYYTQLMILEIHAVRVGNGGNSIDIYLNNDYDSSSIDLTMEPPQQYKQNYRYISATTKETETADTSVSSVFIYQHIIPSKLTLASNVGKSSWVYFMSIDNDGRKAEAAFNEGLRLLKQQTFLLYYQHVAAWKQAWNKGRIEVGDNLQLSKLINSCFYYLISFLPAATTFLPKEQFYGLSPGGLANGANWTDYQGHVFWDMETWMYPGILAFRPDLANDMLSYRIYGMKEAAKRAKQGNYEGLRYPWESAFTGAEQTPDICIPCRENQQHVTGDIALAARQYFSMTQDMTWLKNQSGYEFIRDMGKFWKSRPTWNPVTQQYDINGVMPPDEHAESVNNSVYTNVGAKLSIYYANYVACLMDNTKDDTESWLAVADKIAVPFDSKNNVHPEYDGYYDGNDDRGVKQADVILLGFPQMWPMSKEVRKNDLLKYEIVTNPMGPAMTWGMFSIGWLELGEQEKAADLFRMSYGNYIREPFKIWTEARAGIGAVNFLTGMGGFLQSVIFGYGGLRIHPEYIEFNPRLTPDTTFLRFVDFDYLGNSLDIEIQTGFVSIVATKIDDEHPLVIYVIPTGNIVYIEKDKELRLSRTPFIMASSSVTECPLPTGSSSCVTPISKSVWGGKTVPTASNLVTPVRDVIIYQTNTSSCYSYQACNMATQSLETSQIKNGKTHLTYNFVIGSNLRVYEARGWTKPGDHSDDRNSQSIGIAVIGNFTYNQPSKALLAVLQQLIKCGMENKYISKSYQLIWEKQLEKSDCAVGCPGDQLYCQLTQWRHWKRVNGDSLPYCGELYIIQSTSAPRKTPEPTSTSSTLYVNYSLFLSFSVVISYFYGY